MNSIEMPIKDVLKHWELIHKDIEQESIELKTVPKAGIKCVYCGERQADMRIKDPNDEYCTPSKYWDVCVACNDTIKLQKQMTLETILGMKKEATKTQKQIEAISDETGQPAVTFAITKKGE